jgi:hypothetical protein
VSKAAEPWSLTSLREKLIKIGAKVVSHSRYVTFQLAEVAVSRQMFADILLLIARLGRHLHQHEKPAEANAGGDERKGMPRCGRSGARQRFSAVKRRLRSPLARDEGDLLLAQAGQKGILASKSPTVWRMSVEVHHRQRRQRATGRFDRRESGRLVSFPLSRCNHSISHFLKF